MRKFFGTLAQAWLVAQIATASVAFAADGAVGDEFKLGSFNEATLVLEGKHAGDFKNLNMTLVPQDSGGAAISLIRSGALAGQFDIGTVPLILAIENNVPIKIVWLNAEIATQLVVRSDIAIPDGLRGKTIGATSGTIDAFMATQSLEKMGLKGQVNFADLAPQSMVAAYKTKQIDGAAYVPPVSTAMAAAGGKVVAQTIIPVFVVFSQKFIDSHKETVQTFVCDLAAVHRRFVKDPQPATHDLADMLHIPVQEVEASLPSDMVPSDDQVSDPKWALGGPDQVTNISNIGVAMATSGKVPKAPGKAEVEKLFDTSFAKVAASGGCK
jgi:sulfonate transport system substrate-binding protein